MNKENRSGEYCGRAEITFNALVINQLLVIGLAFDSRPRGRLLGELKTYRSEILPTMWRSLAPLPRGPQTDRHRMASCWRVSSATRRQQKQQQGRGSRPLALKTVCRECAFSGHGGDMCQAATRLVVSRGLVTVFRRRQARLPLRARVAPIASQVNTAQGDDKESVCFTFPAQYTLPGRCERRLVRLRPVP